MATRPPLPLLSLLCRQSKKLAAAEDAVLSKKELENVIADLRRQLGQLQADNAMLQVRGWCWAGPPASRRPRWKCACLGPWAGA